VTGKLEISIVTVYASANLVQQANSRKSFTLYVLLQNSSVL